MKPLDNVLAKANALVILVFVLISIYIVVRLRDWKNSVEPIWLDYVAKITENQKSGKFAAVDKYGTPLVLEWERIEASNSELPEKIKRLCEIFVQAHVPVTLKFLQKYPEVVFTVEEFKPFEKLFKGGTESIDWNFVEKQLVFGSRKNFINRAYSSYGKKDILWFVTVKEKGWNGPVGYVLFLLTPEYEYGVIKVGNLMLLPIAQHRGIGRLLISSIFKILHNIALDRIILRTLQSNEQAISAYLSYGFEKYEEKRQKAISGSLDYYKVNFEYKTDKHDLLQKKSQALQKLGK